jgi:predicted RNA binding protein YcfA (HicA-like mRNA interferase family)
LKGKQLIRKLRQAGVEIGGNPGGTGHLIARHQGKKVPIPFHGDTDIGPKFIAKLCKQLGLDPKKL